MKPVIQPIDNELDIRRLCHSLWFGKAWILGIAAIFALIALTYSYLVQEEWSATAVTDKPTVTLLGSYYSQEQFLRSFRRQTDNGSVLNTEMSIADDVYREFTLQLSSYDVRRTFWLQSDYYQRRKKNHSRPDAMLLEELVNNIVFMPKDDKKNMTDSVKLTAETPNEANQLLRQYLSFVNQRVVENLNQELIGVWETHKMVMEKQLKEQEAAVNGAYQRELKQLQHALHAAQRLGIERMQIDAAPDQLAPSALFLLGESLLIARYEALQAIGPDFDSDYDHQRALLASLSENVVLATDFNTFRYLKTPEDPIKRDKPRRLFLFILWGSIGGLIGAGIALMQSYKNSVNKG